MITRKKQNNTKSFWEPFATSTPLRIISNEAIGDGLPQKQFTNVKNAKAQLLKKTVKTVNNGQGKQISERNGQIPKKVRRNRSSYYIDMSSSSSSSEDEGPCLSNNGPAIKINLGSSTNVKPILKSGDSKKKMFLSPKNSINESNKISVENSGNDKVTKNGKPNDEVISTSQKSDSESKLLFSSKNSSNDHEKKKKKSLFNEKKVTSKNESNSSCQNSKEHKRKKINLNGCECNSSTESSFDLAPTKATGKSSQQNSIDLKSKKNVNLKSPNSFESGKDVANNRKRAQPMISADADQKIEKKRVKNAEGFDESPTNQKKSKLKKIKGFRNDSSHQLFSDSMHQELINSLDLTNMQLENQENIFDSPWKLTPKEIVPKKSRLKGKVVKNINFSSAEKLKRSMRQRQQPKEFWMPRDECDLVNKATSVLKEKLENERFLKRNTNHNKSSHTGLESENELTNENFNQGNVNGNLKAKNNSGMGDALSVFENSDIIEAQNEKVHMLKSAEEVNFEGVKTSTKNVNKLSKTKKLGFTQKCSNKAIDTKKSEVEENQVQSEGNDENKMKVNRVNMNSLPTNFTDVFKHLNQLPTFEDYADGIQTAQCWSLKNFKCGVLKVKNQCHISNKTTFENSYFGGILIKGTLKMTIGNKDLEMSVGDMAFVPPLTEWHIIGTHESESFFYYWCGRFKS